MTTYLGLDVHAKKTVFMAQDEDGKMLYRGDIMTSRKGFEELFRKLGGELGIKVGLESGTQAFWASEELADLGFQPYVINAGEVRAKSRRPNQKSDSRDAFDICDGLRRDLYVSRIYVPSKKVRRLRKLIQQRRFYVRGMTANVSSTKSIFRGEGIRANDTLGTAVAWKEFISGCPDPFFRKLVKMHFRIWKQLSEEVRRLDKQVKELAIKCFGGVYDRMQTIPGVGPVVAATFLSVIADPARFEQSGQVISYLGLSPSTWDSGDRVRHGPITKRGSSEGRSMLVESAQQSCRPAHPLHPYFTRVMAKHNYNKAMVCVAQRLARIMWRMWIEGEDFNVEKLNIVPIKHEKKVKKHWKIAKAG